MASAIAFDFPGTWHKGVPSCQQGEVTKQHHQVRISWCTGPQHLDHCCIVRTEFHPLCRPLMTPLQLGAQRGDNRKLCPFHDWKNSSHHDKSNWNSLLSLIGWSSLRKAERRLIILPCAMAFLWPGDQECADPITTEMPKTVRKVKGPSNLSGGRGIAQSWNCWE